MRKLTFIVILLLVVFTVSMAAYDYVARPKAAKDLLEYLIPIPQKVIEEHGYSERTAILYNLAFIKEVCQAYEIRIKTLEDQVAELVAANIPKSLAEGEVIIVPPAIDSPGIFVCAVFGCDPDTCELTHGVAE